MSIAHNKLALVTLIATVCLRGSKEWHKNKNKNKIRFLSLRRVLLHYTSPSQLSSAKSNSQKMVDKSGIPTSGKAKSGFSTWEISKILAKVFGVTTNFFPLTQLIIFFPFSIIGLCLMLDMNSWHRVRIDSALKLAFNHHRLVNSWRYLKPNFLNEFKLNSLSITALFLTHTQL